MCWEPAGSEEGGQTQADNVLSAHPVDIPGITDPLSLQCTQIAVFHSAKIRHWNFGTLTDSLFPAWNNYVSCIISIDISRAQITSIYQKFQLIFFRTVNQQALVKHLITSKLRWEAFQLFCICAALEKRNNKLLLRSHSTLNLNLILHPILTSRTLLSLHF